jgi:quinohemoprotein ethanol dehydrogenase
VPDITVHAEVNYTLSWPAQTPWSCPAPPFCGLGNDPRKRVVRVAMRDLLAVVCLMAAAAVQAGPDDGRNWLSYGGSSNEDHFSPLQQIGAKSVSRLGLAWSLDLDVTNSIAVPLAVDGVIYLAAGMSTVHAVDAASGKLLWRYDPQVTAVAGKKLRVAWGIRGLAYWQRKLYVGTPDGRLLALDAPTGKLIWSVQTLDPQNGAFISGAPRVFNGKVVIGNGGADFAGVRGYVTAYDAESGRQLWRFYTVPGNPAAGFESPAMAMAAKTWTGEWWKLGGGGTVWNAITYDAELNRVYLGTGNGAPWNPKIRSPQGGDNLFLASIVALDADSGQYLWHYQQTPGEAWDYNSSTDITLTTLPVNGKATKVILNAPKNGFFYVLDRENGKLISAEKLGHVTWAERVDLKTGRPVEAPNARYTQGDILLYPSFQGLHHWLPQSYSPLTGLIYIPTLEMGAMYSDQGIDKKAWRPIPWSPSQTGLALGDADVPQEAGKSILKAWDPRTQKEAWSVTTRGISNGGTLATAGGLVFQGLADGYLHAYSATTGKSLWSYFSGTAVTGVPITYSVAGKQYLSITAGPLGGASGGFGSVSAQFGWHARLHPKRLLTFVLDGKAKLPPTPPPVKPRPLEGPEVVLTPDAVELGSKQYLRCVLCHGPGVVAGGNAPDLRASPAPLTRESFATIVREGTLEQRGMPKFDDLTDAELESIRQYIRWRARESLKAAPSATAH